MTSISNLVCTLMHRETEAEGLVTEEKLCVVGERETGGCGGE